MFTPMVTKIYNKIWWCEDHKPVMYKNKQYYPLSIHREYSSEKKDLVYVVYLSGEDGQFKVFLDEIKIKD